MRSALSTSGRTGRPKENSLCPFGYLAKLDRFERFALQASTLVEVLDYERWRVQVVLRKVSQEISVTDERYG